MPLADIDDDNEQNEEMDKETKRMQEELEKMKEVGYIQYYNMQIKVKAKKKEDK